jgi:hypothetical protein
VVILLVGCAQQPPAKQGEEKASPEALPPLPATYITDADCPGCLEVTLTLRPDGSYLVRDQLGASEFYDFGRWKYSDGTLELVGGREAPRRYQLKDLRKTAQAQALRGPFRMLGLYDGTGFKECRTGLTWRLADTRAAENLKGDFLKGQGNAVLVVIDAQLEGAPEMLRVLRPAAVLDARTCPG